MFRVLMTVILVGGLGLGGAVLWRDPGLRQALWEKGGAVLDDALGIQAPRKDKTNKAAERVALPSPQKPVTLPAPVVTVPAPAPYVDRSPTPSAVERVQQKDRQWLDDVIAKRAEKPAKR